MFNISQFLDRMRRIQGAGFAVRAAAQNAIKKYLSIDIPLEAITFSSSSITLTGISQGARSQIFIKKESILHEINSIQHIRKISDIR